MKKETVFMMNRQKMQFSLLGCYGGVWAEYLGTEYLGTTLCHQTVRG